MATLSALAKLGVGAEETYSRSLRSGRLCFWVRHGGSVPAPCPKVEERSPAPSCTEGRMAVGLLIRCDVLRSKLCHLGRRRLARRVPGVLGWFLRTVRSGRVFCGGTGGRQPYGPFQPWDAFRVTYGFPAQRAHSPRRQPWPGPLVARSPGDRTGRGREDSRLLYGAVSSSGAIAFRPARCPDLRPWSVPRSRYLRRLPCGAAWERFEPVLGPASAPGLVAQAVALLLALQFCVLWCGHGPGFSRAQTHLGGFATCLGWWRCWSTPQGCAGLKWNRKDASGLDSGRTGRRHDGPWSG